MDAYLDSGRAASARTARERAAERPGRVRFEEELALIADMLQPEMREQVATWRAYASGASDAYRDVLYSGWGDGDFARLLEFARQWALEKNDE